MQAAVEWSRVDLTKKILNAWPTPVKPPLYDHICLYGGAPREHGPKAERPKGPSQFCMFSSSVQRGAAMDSPSLWDQNCYELFPEPFSPMDWSFDESLCDGQGLGSSEMEVGGTVAPAASIQPPPMPVPVLQVSPRSLFEHQLVENETLLQLVGEQPIRQEARGKGFTWLALDVDSYDRKMESICSFSLTDDHEHVFRGAAANAPSSITGTLFVKVEVINENEWSHFRVVEKKEQSGAKRNPRTRMADEAREAKDSKRICKLWNQFKAGTQVDEVELKEAWQRDLHLVSQLESLLAEGTGSFGDEASRAENVWWANVPEDKIKLVLSGKLASGNDSSVGMVYALPFYYKKHDRVLWFCRTLCQMTQMQFLFVKGKPDGPPFKTEYILEPHQLLELVRAKRIILHPVINTSISTF